MSGDSTTAAALPATAIVQRAHEARTYSLSPTEAMRFMFSGGRDEPDFFDERLGRGDGPPLHRHPWATWELVLDGDLRAVVGDDELRLGAGDFLYTPPDTPHTYVVESDAARLVGFNLPGGRFEGLQREAEPLFAAEDGPDMERLVALAADHDVEILGPPLSPSPG